MPPQAGRPLTESHLAEQASMRPQTPPAPRTGASGRELQEVQRILGEHRADQARLEEEAQRQEELKRQEETRRQEEMLRREEMRRQEEAEAMRQQLLREG